eukprot:TRINITY_DN47942_c0_g1_i1.p1 TRINITY_DN47942_c0_g1~~TRINITY_DN47942_c0_g1_i1.p1  ORF type:complete len:104 (+),score=12.85 TRINITY_DN47942_c0_g1_i1:316-627(+)
MEPQTRLQLATLQFSKALLGHLQLTPLPPRSSGRRIVHRTSLAAAAATALQTAAPQQPLLRKPWPVPAVLTIISCATRAGSAAEASAELQGQHTMALGFRHQH